MPHYKLTYFDVRGLGEVARQLFVLADVPFEDVRIPRADEATWQKMKTSTPFGQMPILEIFDGDESRIEIPQSAAIGRYLARKFGFAGKTPEEEALVDGVVDLFKDFIYAQKQYTAALRDNKSDEEKNKVIRDILNPAKSVYFAGLRKLLAASSSGFLVGDSLTWADLQIADNLTTLKGLGFFDEEPLLEEFYSKIWQQPKLNEYLKGRRESLL